jgi:hypothetical protein
LLLRARTQKRSVHRHRIVPLFLEQAQSHEAVRSPA